MELKPMNEVPLERRVELQNLYLRNMQEIKWRIEAIDEIRSGKITTRFLQTNIEFCVLQIRKILELIALSALVSDADTYKDKLGKIETMWNARLILQDIERIHSDFYPHPIRTVKDKWVDVECEYLTKDKFIKVYEKCGKMLHESSPFIDEETTQQEYRQIWDDIPQWRGWIITLLNTHIIQLYNRAELFYIIMQSKDNGYPTGNIFSQVTEEEQNEPHEI